MKKVLTILILLIFFLSGCDRKIETIYDGTTLKELDELTEYHFLGTVIEKVDSEFEFKNFLNYDYYKVKIDEKIKGDIDKDYIYIKFSTHISDFSKLVIDEKYHFYCNKTTNVNANVTDKENVFLISSSKAQCFTLEEYEERLILEQENLN